jgi:ribosomal protein L37AE/L43A
MATRILAKCPRCERSLPVIVGRKSTARVARCDGCGTSFDYSAWLLKTPRPDDGGVSLRSFYQVELHEVTH